MKKRISDFFKAVEEKENTKWDYAVVCTWILIVLFNAYQFFMTDEVSLRYVLSGGLVVICMITIMIKRAKQQKKNRK